MTITIPDNLDLNDKEAAMLLATKLYEQGKLTIGQAAELAGFSKRNFMQLLGGYDVSIFNYGPSELEKDTTNASNYHI